MKFTLRELFLLTVIVALLLGWFLSYRSRHRQLEDAVELLRLTDNDARLWKYRAEEVTTRVRKSGWKVDWSGDWSDHMIDIQSPEELKKTPPEE